MKIIKLDEIKVNNNRVDYYFTPSDDIKYLFNKGCHMFCEFDISIEEVPKSILAIPFISNFMPLIWLLNGMLWVKEVDRKYYDSISRIKAEYQNMYSEYKLGGCIIPVKTIDNSYNIERESLLLFSGGIDAITTCIRILEKKPLLVNIYGWYENKVVENKVFNSDKNKVLNFSKRYNLKNNFIKSNFATCIIAEEVNKLFQKKIGVSWWLGLQHGMAFIGHAIPLAYKFKVRNIYIASSHNFYSKKRHKCSTDPAIDIQTKYASGGVIHDGFELNRQNKVRIISNEQKRLEQDYFVQVCSFNEENCCECDKCIRTMLELIAEGADLNKFGFYIEGSFLEHFKNIMERKIQFLGIEAEYNKYWIDSKNRMIENYDNIKEKEFVDWFLTQDFIEMRKKGLRNYRIKNFIPIIKRKIFGK